MSYYLIVAVVTFSLYLEKKYQTRYLVRSVHYPKEIAHMHWYYLVVIVLSPYLWDHCEFVRFVVRLMLETCQWLYCLFAILTGFCVLYGPNGGSKRLENGC